MDGELGLGMENDDAWTAEGGLAAMISSVADEESTKLANNLGERLEDAGLAYTRQQYFIKSVTVPEVMVPYARETGKLFANSNIFGQYALMKAMLARRRAYLTAVYGTMQMEIDEIEEKQASLDKEIAIVKKALQVTAEFHAKITTGKEGLAATEALKASLNAEHSRATNTAGLHAVGGTAGFLAPSTPSRSGTMRKPCDSRGSLATRFGCKHLPCCTPSSPLTFSYWKEFRKKNASRIPEPSRMAHRRHPRHLTRPMARPVALVSNHMLNVALPPEGTRRRSMQHVIVLDRCQVLRSATLSMWLETRATGRAIGRVKCRG